MSSAMVLLWPVVTQEAGHGVNEDGCGWVTVLARTAEVITPLIRSRVDGLPSEIRYLAGLHFGWSSDDRGAVEGTGESKMVRPALALLACEAVGGAPGAAHAAAVAVELVHNASLLHDDIIDHSPLRRGRRALWTTKGVPAAILAGDALFFAAVQTLAEASDAGHTLPVLVGCVQVLIQGEYLDTLLEAGTDLSEDRAVAVAAAKTGELLACACALGALAGGADPRRTGHLRAFGQHLGIAFQCADDLLSIWGDERMTGKPDQSDLRSRKISVPVAAAMATNTPQARELRALYHRKKPLSDDDCRHAAELIEQTGARTRTFHRAQRHTAQALEHLALANPAPNPDRQLAALTHFVTHRDR